MIGIEFSVIVCTYNRSEILPQCLKSLTEQKFPRDRFEIVVVDNNSKDNTKGVVESFVKSSPITIKYVFEPKQGLSHARNRGVSESSGEVVAFIDDDSIVSPEWLKNVAEAFKIITPQPLCVGGKISLLWKVQKPLWFHDSKGGFLGELDYGSDIIPLKYPKTPYGGNMAFKKEFLIGIGGFDITLGRQGGLLLSNEEIDIFKKMFERGCYNVVYHPKAVIEHLVLDEKIQKVWFYRRHYWQGRSEVLMSNNLSRGKALQDIFRNLKEIFYNIIRVSVAILFLKPKSRSFLHTCTIFERFGKVVQLSMGLVKR